MYHNDLIRAVGKSMYRRYVITAASDYVMNELVHQGLVDEHTAIVAAVLAKDGEAAIAALENHLAAAKLREKQQFSAA